MLTSGSLWRSGTKEVELEFPLGSISQTQHGALEILVGSSIIKLSTHWGHPVE